MTNKSETGERPNVRCGAPSTVWVGHNVTLERLFINGKEVDFLASCVPNRLYGSYINEEGEAC